MIKINLDKAKEIKKEKLRIERKPMLEALDSEYIQAIEKNENIDSIVQQKQKLRDITNLVDKAKSVNDLKKIQLPD